VGAFALLKAEHALAESAIEKLMFVRHCFCYQPSSYCLLQIERFLQYGCFS